MSADEKTREIARVREKALYDEASYMETARIEGRAEERRELLAQLRALGVDETKLSQAVSNLQN